MIGTLEKSGIKVLSGNSDIVSQFQESEKDKGRAEGTIRIYGFELRRLQKWLSSTGGSLESITRFDVQQYLDALINGLVMEGGHKASATTVDRIFGTICAFSRFINRPNVVGDIRRPQKRPVNSLPPQSLNRNERNQLFRDVERDGNLRNIAIVYMLAYTGLRIEELVRLNRENIEMKKEALITVIGKGNKERKVPFPKEARYHVRNYLETRSDDLDALFLSNYGKRLSKRSAQRVIEKYGHHAHELRHTCFRYMLKNGWDIVTVSQIAGHESIETTKRYTLASEKEISKKMDELYLQ